MTGGSPKGSIWTSVELLHNDGSPWCSLPGLPEGRWYHTQTGLEACGGVGGIPGATVHSTTYANCVRLQAGSWRRTHTLEEYRHGHSSWASPAGTLLMGGNRDSVWGQRTELLGANSFYSVKSFSLRYRTR